MPHSARLIAILVLATVAIGGGIWRRVKRREAPPYEETALLSPEVRARLAALRAESKFAAADAYPGPRGPKTRAALSAVIDGLLDDILAEPDGPIEASDLAGRLGLSVAAVAKRNAADARRAHGYMLEIWWIFGFRSAAGYFRPEDGVGEVAGWAEPLPPGWGGPEGRLEGVNPTSAPSTSGDRDVEHHERQLP